MASLRAACRKGRLSTLIVFGSAPGGGVELRSTRDRRPPDAVFVTTCHPELLEKALPRLASGARSSEPRPQRVVERIHRRARHDLLVEADYARLAPLLEQVGEELLTHVALAAADAMEPGVFWTNRLRGTSTFSTAASSPAWSLPSNAPSLRLTSRSASSSCSRASSRRSISRSRARNVRKCASALRGLNPRALGDYCEEGLVVVRGERGDLPLKIRSALSLSRVKIGQDAKGNEKDDKETLLHDSSS